MRTNDTAFGVSTLLFREFPLEKALQKISKTSIKKIDLAIILPSFCPHYLPLETDAEDDKKLKELLQRYQLTLSTLNVSNGYFNEENPDIVSKFIRRCVQIGKYLGVYSITIPTGKKVDEKDWLSHAKIVKKYLEEEIEVAFDSGITLSIEAPHKGTLTETLEEANRFYGIINSELIKFTFDTSHVLSNKNDALISGIQKIGVEKINHVHLRDAINEDISITPGKGNGDFKSFFKHLKDNHYNGDLIFELEYHDYSELEKFRELEFALQYCSYLYFDKDLPFRLKIQSNKFVQLYKRLLRDPKAEVRRHEGVLTVARKVYPIFLKLQPDTVYEGSWKKKYRFGKKKAIPYKAKSVVIENDPQKILRVGIIGCGWAGMEMHGPGFGRLNNVQIIGGYDIDDKKSLEFASRYGGKAFDRLEDLIKVGEPDIVSICSREWAHYEATIFALQNKVDVFCEKLMATRYNHAEEMVSLAKRNNCILGINYNYRYMPGIRKIKEVIEQKALGDLCFFNINVHAMAYAHALDLLSFLGGRINTVSGVFRNDNTVRTFRNTDWSVYDEDILYVPSIYASVCCEFEKGFMGTVNSSFFYDLDAFILSIDAVFQKGVLTLNGINLYNALGNLSYSTNEKIRKVDMDHKKTAYGKSFAYTFYSSIESFIRNYSHHKSVEIPGEQGLFNLELEKAIYRSNEEKTKIDLSRLYEGKK